MLMHFAARSFSPLCQRSELKHTICTNVLVDVNCENCLEIVDNIAAQHEKARK